MQMINLTDKGEKISTSTIEAFEKKIGKKFPVEFKEFLIKNNGGYPDKILFTPKFIEINPVKHEKISQGTDIEQFLPLDDISVEYQDILDENYIPSE